MTSSIPVMDPTVFRCRQRFLCCVFALFYGRTSCTNATVRIRWKQWHRSGGKSWGEGGLLAKTPLPLKLMTLHEVMRDLQTFNLINVEILQKKLCTSFLQTKNGVRVKNISLSSQKICGHIPLVTLWSTSMDENGLKWCFEKGYRELWTPRSICLLLSWASGEVTLVVRNAGKWQIFFWEYRTELIRNQGRCDMMWTVCGLLAHVLRKIAIFVAFTLLTTCSLSCSDGHGSKTLHPTQSDPPKCFSQNLTRLTVSRVFSLLNCRN